MRTRCETIEDLDKSIDRVNMIMNRSLRKMERAKSRKDYELHRARAQRSSITLKALLALQERERAAHEFYTASDQVAARLSELRHSRSVYRQAVSAHSELVTPDIFMV